jgi:hypothetical protein
VEFLNSSYTLLYLVFEDDVSVFKEGVWIFTGKNKETVKPA